MKTLCSLSMLTLFACQPDRGVENPEDVAEHPEFHVKVWVDPASTLPEQEMLDGCDAWVSSGVGCDLVADIDESDVQIYADQSECVLSSDGTITLAYASCCGPIMFFSECFKFNNGDWDSEALVTVAAHEIGHQFGLWWHVSTSCRNAPMHPSGDSVCGAAVMNPFYSRANPFPNMVDGLAFDIRDQALSVVDGHNHHDAGESSTQPFTCMYTTRP